MPLSILIRNDFSPNHYRDLILELLKSESITSCYILSGFFSDFTEKLPNNDPDISISKEMQDKEIFLFGDDYNDNDNGDKKKHLDDFIILTKKLKDKGLNVKSYKLTNSEDRLFKLQLHAKIALFCNNKDPVLSIIGSSNFTSSSMYGDSQCVPNNYPPKFVQIESDVIFWLKEKKEINDAIYTVFNRWADGKWTPKIYFDDENFDNEFIKLLGYIENSLLKFTWSPLDNQSE